MGEVANPKGKETGLLSFFLSFLGGDWGGGAVMYIKCTLGACHDDITA